jgi:hypothetical protein
LINFTTRPKRLREELAELQVEINEEKSRIVDLGRRESFGFLGFDFRQARSLWGAWRGGPPRARRERGRITQPSFPTVAPPVA